MERSIVAMGGGGFSMEPRNPRLDLFLLGLANASRPRVCFVPTASGDADGYIARFHRSFRRLRCRPTHLSLFRPPRELPVLSQDILYVGGGNTKNMLAIWRDWGFDRLLRRAWERGIVLAGISAGSICWFEEGLTDSTGSLTPLRCLGFLPGSNCPHYDGERLRRPVYRRMVATGRMRPGLAADDGAALHFVGTRLADVVSSRPGARAWRVGRSGETEIRPRYLESNR